MRRSLAAAAVAAFTFTAAPVAMSTADAAAEPVRIMPLGDSITGSPGCWRALLWNQLQSAGHTDIDFVGTLPAQGCGVAHDGDNRATAASSPRPSPPRTCCRRGRPRPTRTSC